MHSWLGQISGAWFFPPDSPRGGDVTPHSCVNGACGVDAFYYLKEVRIISYWFPPSSGL